MTSENATELDLQVPQAAIDTLNVCGVDAHLHDRDDACVKAIAAPVVAAELRRIADSWDHGHGVMTAPHEYVAESLRARADELDPPAGTRED